MMEEEITYREFEDVFPDDEPEVEPEPVEETEEPAEEGGEEQPETLEQPEPEPEPKESPELGEIRRQFLEARARAVALEAQNKRALAELKGFGFDGDDLNAALVAANAHRTGRTPEEVRAELDKATELERLRMQNSALEGERAAALQAQAQARAEARMQADLAAIQAIDPEVKSLDALGGEFLKLISAGFDGAEAFKMVRAKESYEQKKPPEKIGKIGAAKGEKDYFTESELDALTEKELDDPAVLAKAEKSLARLGGRRR